MPGFATSLPAQFQSNTVDIEVQVVDPGGITASPTVCDMSAYGMRVSVGDTPTGSSGGPVPLALSTLTWNAASVPTSPSRFVGSLALNTAAIDTYLGALPSKTAYFEVNLTIAGTRITIFQGSFEIKAVVDEGTSTVPTPTDTYLTKNESLATLVRKVGLPGELIVLTSPDGVYGRELGVSNSGAPIDNIIVL